DEDRDHHDVVPPEAADDVPLDRPQRLLRGLREADGEDAGNAEHDECRPEDTRVDATPPRVHDQVLTGLVLLGWGRWSAARVGWGGHRSVSFWVSDNAQNRATA